MVSEDRWRRHIWSVARSATGLLSTRRKRDGTYCSRCCINRTDGLKTEREREINRERRLRINTTCTHISLSISGDKSSFWNQIRFRKYRARARARSPRTLINEFGPRARARNVPVRPEFFRVLHGKVARREKKILYADPLPHTSFGSGVVHIYQGAPFSENLIRCLSLDPSSWRIRAA
jgi:hypothetical protein